jgi:hypothetical protein
LFLVVLLVVILSDDEISGGQDLRSNRSSYTTTLGQSIARGDGDGFLIGTVEEHSSKILAADVHALTVGLDWIVVRPEDLDQVFIGHAVGIVSNPHGFDVAGSTTADLFVSRIRNVATGVARFSAQYAIYSTVGGFDSPESARGKGGLGAGEIGWFR